MQLVPALIVTAAVVATGAMVPGNLASDRASQGRQAPKPTDRADAILSAARNSVGGVAALAAVVTLDVDAVEERLATSTVPNGVTVFDADPEPFGFRMRWPDRFQLTRRWFVHTLDGSEYWKRQTGGPPVPDTPDLERTARRSTELNSAYMALAFLLRVPPSLRWSPRDGGVVTVDGIEGPMVEFVGASGSGPRMVFDAARRTPLALVTRARQYDASGSERDVEVVKRLEDYRRVGGLLFPFRLDERTPGRHAITRVKSIRVNPPFGPREFAKPVR
jgi:hypothetical protein